MENSQWPRNKTVSQDRMSPCKSVPPDAWSLDLFCKAPPPNRKFQQPIKPGAAKLLVKKSGELLVVHDISLMTQRIYMYRICSLDFIYIDTKYIDRLVHRSFLVCRVGEHSIL